MHDSRYKRQQNTISQNEADIVKAISWSFRFIHCLYQREGFYFVVGWVNIA